nr:MAG TPA: hypothetical protein [Caudoviricetes sp.]
MCCANSSRPIYLSLSFFTIATFPSSSKRRYLFSSTLYHPFLCTLYILILVLCTIFVNSYFCTLYNFCR